MESDSIFTLIACVAVALVLKVLLPPVVGLLGWSRVSYATEAGSEELRAEGTAPWIAPLCQKMEEAGFEPLARVRIRVQPMGDSWRRNITTRLYAADDALFSIFQLQPCELPRFALHSIFEDGTVLATGISMPEKVVQDPQYIRWAVETRDPAVLLAAHRWQTQRQVSEGAVLVPPRSVEVFEQISDAEWRSPACQSTLKMHAGAFLLCFAVIALLVAMPLYLLAVPIREIAVAGIIGAAAILFLTSCIVPAIRAVAHLATRDLPPLGKPR